MKTEASEIDSKLDAVYHEESAKLPLLALGIALVLVVAPLVLTISRINTEGLKAASISKYTNLIQMVGVDARAVETAQNNHSESADSRSHSVTLVIPELVIVDELKPEGISPLNIDIKGIYWNPTRPLVDIDNETYYVGEKIQGYEIVKIGKTTVHFKAKDGSVVVKDFYENLFYSKK